MKATIAVVLMLLIAGTGLCQAGWLDSTLEGVGKRLGNRAVNDAGNSAYDQSKGAIKGGNKSTSSKESSGSKQPSQRGYYQQNVQGGEAAVTVDSLSIEEAERVLTKFDFIPGDKTIFFDDFSDTDVGEFPRKWTLDGPKQGNSNTVEVVEYHEKRFLRSVPGAKGQPPATQYLRLDQKVDFPEKFTIEFDAVLAPVKEGSTYHNVYRVLFVPVDKRGDVFKWNGPHSVNISGKESNSANTKTNVGKSDGMVHHVSISVNGSFVKAYIDNQRVINDPDGIRRPIKQVGLQMQTPNSFKCDKLLFTNFRLAAGGKDIKSALDTDGKIITHGILFDIGRDTLKAESLPTLKMILGLMKDEPEIKFSIEGHTDNQGSKGINQPLSERRAEAVKAWLEGKGIESYRLRTEGFGDSKPIDNNKTLEGRANNRRVEFVKF